MRCEGFDTQTPPAALDVVFRIRTPGALREASFGQHIRYASHWPWAVESYVAVPGKASQNRTGLGAKSVAPKPR